MQILHVLLNRKGALIFTLFISIVFTGSAQNQKIHLPQHILSIQHIFQEIEKQTGLSVDYNHTQLDISRTVNLKTTNTSLANILNEIFRENGFTYKIEKEHIIVKQEVNNTGPLNQNRRNVTGVVKDEYGEPVIGANVIEKGTTNGIITDVDGRFSLTIADNAILQISYIGYTSTEIRIGERSDYGIVLKEDLKTLEEVVVVGFGVQKKVNMTGAIATVNGDELTKRPVYNIAASMQGKLPGLSVNQGSGQPGDENTILRVRGLGTFSDAGSDPLVIIDGIAGNINSINSLDIESISVLKDAASAAIYGARAANGVVLITTKSGKAGKISITYDANYAVHNPTRMLKVITNSAEYMELKNEAITNSGLSNNRKYPDATIDLYRNATDRNLYPNYDWLDLMFNPALAYSHNINVNGGGSNTVYNTTIGYSNQDGVMRGFNNEKINFSINTKTEINKFIVFGTKANFYYYDTKSPVVGAEDLFLSTLAQAPTYGPLLPDGSGRYTYRAYDYEDNNKNPYANAKEATAKKRGYEANLNAWIDIKFTDYLTWHTKVAANGTFNKMKKFYPLIPQYNYHTGEFATNLNVAGTQQSLNVKDENELFTTVYSHFTFDKQFGDHGLKVLAGYNQETYKYEYLEGYKEGFSGNNLHELDAGATDGQKSSGSAKEWAIQSLLGRINYDYLGRYLLEANVRYDGTSRLHEDYRWDAFPSVSAGWRVSEENFMNPVDWLNNLKLRVSWGELGNQNIGNYPYQEMLKLGYNYTFDNSSVSSGAAPEKVSNKKLLWERTKVWDAGFDLTVLSNRLSLEFDYYRKETTGILRSSQIPGNMGLGAPTINDGSVTNTGIELSITHQNQLANGLFYSVSGYITKNKNELTSFGEDEIESRTIKTEGKPWNSFYLYKWIGVFQDEDEIKNHAQQPYNPQPGDLKYADISGPDGKPDGKIDSHDKVIIGGRFPKFEYTFNLNAEYKHFFVSAFFYGVEGIKYYVDGWGFEPFSQGAPPTVNWRNRWTPENKTNELPRIYIARETPSMSGMPSTFFLKDASFFRLKNLQVGYTFQQDWLKKAKINSARFYLSADNLFTITNYPYLDPERKGDGNFAVYPQNKVFSIGTSINF